MMTLSAKEIRQQKRVCVGGGGGGSGGGGGGVDTIRKKVWAIETFC